MIEAKCDVKGRIAIPGTFRIEKDAAVGTDENIFRTDIAMNQRQPRRGGPVDQGMQLRSEIGVAPRHFAEIRVEPDREKYRVAAKAVGDVAPPGRAGVDRREMAADRAGDARIGLTAQQIRLPKPITR